MKKLGMLLAIFILAVSMLMAGGQKESTEKTIKISYATWMTKGEDKFWIDEFNAQNPGIEVKMEMLEGGKYPELMQTRILSNDIPDVMMLMPVQVQDYSREGYLADITGSPVAELQKRSPMAADFSSKDGKVYSVNIVGGFMGHVWYNKKLFADLGLSVPRTMDEFWKACEVLKIAGKDPMLLGGADTWTYKMLRFATWTSFAGPAIEATGFGDIGEAMYNDADVADIYTGHAEFVKKLVDNDYLVRASLTTTYPQSSQLFVDGNVGMFPQGPWVASLPEVVSADPDKFELGVFAIPMESAQGQRFVLADMDRFLSVSAKSKYPEAAMRLFNFMTSKQNLEGYLEFQGLTTLLDLEYELDQTIIDFKNLVTADNYTAVPYIFPVPAAWEDQESMMPKNIQSGASVKQAVSEVKNYYIDAKETIKF